jgi:hypothetical protein
VKRATRSPGWAAAYAEAQARARLNHERALNCVIASRNPHLSSTERYQRGRLPSSDPRFYSTAGYLSYVWRREMGRFDPHVDYPAPDCPLLRTAAVKPAR